VNYACYPSDENHKIAFPPIIVSRDKHENRNDTKDFKVFAKFPSFFVDKNSN
jgi:hypothetical protein